MKLGEKDLAVPTIMWSMMGDFQDAATYTAQYLITFRDQLSTRITKYLTEEIFT